MSSSSKTVCDVVGVVPPFACSYMSCVTLSALQQLVLKCTLTVGSGSDDTDVFHLTGALVQFLALFDFQLLHILLNSAETGSDLKVQLLWAPV